MDGILLIDKPLKWSSFDVVNKVRFTVAQDLGVKPKRVKVGHTGTLDPYATGLMVIVIGKYTKKAAEFSGLDKTYDCEMTLGQTSTTGDVEGELTDVSQERPSEGDIKGAMAKFVGEIEQTPPIYSAIKIDGKPAYARARSGEVVEMKKRKVTIYDIAYAKYDYPKCNFVTTVSSGTYIRSLVQDIGEVLSTGAYMSALRRTSVGEFGIKDAISPDSITIDDIRKKIITK